MYGNKSTKILMCVALGVSLALVIICLLWKAGIIETDLLNDEFKPKGTGIEQMANSVVDHVTKKDMTDYEKYKALHDWLVNYAYYDHENVNTASQTHHNGLVLLSTKRGVCDAYSYAYQALCHSAGLYCGVVLGKTSGGGHAWNTVMIDSVKYHVDCTWDDWENKNGDDACYDYWLLSDETMRSYDGRSFTPQDCNSKKYENKELPLRYNH